MGCDIHIMVESKIDGQWFVKSGVNESMLNHYEEMLEDVKINPDGNHGHLTKEYIEGCIAEESKVVYQDWIYDGRNYDLFAILADVRNGRGFAGAKTGEGFIPISNPRGVPDDASAVYKNWVEEWDGDGHSHSFHTIRKLVEYPHWDNGATQFGVVSESEYKVFKEQGIPNSYCSYCSGGGVVHITNQEMDDVINGSYPIKDGAEYYTRVQWKEGYKDAAGNFYTESIPRLKELAGDDLDSVRIVFFFDN